MSLRFTMADLERANDEWGCNCGPATLAAICDLTLDEARRHFGAPWPRYTNPTGMRRALAFAGKDVVELGPQPHAGLAMRPWPRWGICRIQWEGPWMAPNVPAAARYQRTHWVGSSRMRRVDGTESDEVCVWDVNQMGQPLDGDGWAPISWWTSQVVPKLTAATPRATGGWHITHAIEIARQP